MMPVLFFCAQGISLDFRETDKRSLPNTCPPEMLLEPLFFSRIHICLALQQLRNGVVRSSYPPPCSSFQSLPENWLMLDMEHQVVAAGLRDLGGHPLIPTGIPVEGINCRD